MYQLVDRVDRDVQTNVKMYKKLQRRATTYHFAVIDEARTSTVITRPRNLHHEQSRREMTLSTRDLTGWYFPHFTTITRRNKPNWFRGWSLIAVIIHPSVILYGI